MSTPPLNPFEDFLQRLNDAAQAAADLGASERLTVWVRQAMLEFPIVQSFIAQSPETLLWWLKLGNMGWYQKYILNGCGEDAAVEMVRKVQERLR